MTTLCIRVGSAASRTICYLLLLASLLIALSALPCAAQDLSATPFDPEQDGIFKSADGTFLAFETDKVLVPEDTNGSTDVYVKNLRTGQTVLASLYQGEPIPLNSGLSVDAMWSPISFASNPVSQDGRFVYFFILDGSSTYLVRRDLVNRVTEEVSTEGGYWSDLKGGSKVSLSADGRFALYATHSDDFNFQWVLVDMTQRTRQVVEVGATDVDFRLTSDGSRIFFRVRGGDGLPPVGFIDRANFSNDGSGLTPPPMRMSATIDGVSADLNAADVIYYDSSAINKSATRLALSLHQDTNDHNWLQYVDTTTGSTSFVMLSGIGAATSADLSGSTSFVVGPFSMSDDGRFVVFTYGIYAAYLADTATGTVTSLPVQLTVGRGDISITGDGKKIFVDGQTVLNPFADRATVSPASGDFGLVAVNTSSAAIPFTFTNPGSNPVTLSTLSVTGANAADFAVSNDSCSKTTVAAGGSCSVAVTFAPAETGARSATLTVPSANGTVQAQLSGSGGYPLDVIKNGAGTVTSSPAVINCGPTCSAVFLSNARVTLTATAADGAAFSGWSGAGCSGVGTCTVTMDKADSVTATFVAGSTCSQAIGDLIITGSSCRKFSDSSDFSGAIGIAHKDSPGNPMLKMADGNLHVENLYNRISSSGGTSEGSLLYVPNVPVLGNVPISWAFTFDVSGAKLQKPTDASQIVSEVFQKRADLLLGFSLSLDSITLTADAAQVEGKLSSTLLARKMFTYMDGTYEKPVELAAGVTFSQLKGFQIDKVEVKATEMSVAGTPVALKDVLLSIDYEKKSLTIGGELSVKRLLQGGAIGGKISLVSGGLDAITGVGKELNIPLGTSPVFLNKLEGSVENITKPPMVFKAKASFSGGPQLEQMDFLGKFKAMCANDVQATIDLGSKYSFTGGIGLLCAEEWESYKNGAIRMQVDSSYSPQTNIFQLDGDILFPGDIFKGKARISITPDDMTGTTAGTFCTPKDVPFLGGNCFLGQNGLINKKGFGESMKLLSHEIAIFAEWATFTDILNASKHIRVGTNLNQLSSQARKATRSAGGAREAARAAGPTVIAVPAGLDFAIIRAEWHEGTTDVSLTAPDGTQLTPDYAAAHPAEVRYMKLDSEAWYALEHPAAGSWGIELASPDAIGDYTVSLNTLNAKPAVALVSPDAPVTSSTAVNISYTASDPDSTPTIALYYSPNATGGGVKIVDGLAVPSGTGSYLWDVSAVPPGSYYLYAVIDDGVNLPVVSYAAGTVEVTNASAPAAPANLVASANGTAIDVSWAAVGGAAGYQVYATDNPALAGYPIEVALPGDVTSYTLANLKPGTAYRVTVGVTGANGVQGQQAQPVVVSTASLPVPAISVSQAAIDFGAVPFGESKSAALTISNEGDADLTISGAAIAGANSSLVALPPELSQPAVIAAGQSRTVILTLQATAAGSLNATLILDSNDPAAPRKIVALTASTPYQSYTLTYLTGANGTLTGSASQTVSNGGSAAAVSAVPAPGYHFVNWTGTNGFVTSTENPLTVTNATSSQAITANFAADAIGGVCGPSNGGAFTRPPETALCATGSASPVTGTGPWNWSCAGTNGGASAGCRALRIRAGDCDSDGQVTIAEVQSAINMFLGLKTVGACVDSDGSGDVSIAEVQRSINSFLGL